MGNVLGELFGDIADAIREKSGSDGTMKPAAFPDAIRAIQNQAEPMEVDILAETRVEGFVPDGPMMLAQTAADYTLTLGETYFVVWDGATYECVGQDMSVMVPGAVGLGDLRHFGGTGNGEPFALGAASGMALYAAMDEQTSHTIRIYQQTTGSLADLRYVSFMSYDGQYLYGRKAVAVGDDCADPLVRGLFTTPTRETTDQYTYSFAGWSRTMGGDVDSTVLKTVHENRTLYAKFTAAVRYYTVTYYDFDGVTVLKTESLAYGTIPDYAPAKVGFTFNGWTTEVLPVTGDAAYYAAAWTEKMDFNALTWEQISALCKSGNVAEIFDIGQRKTFTFRHTSTVAYTATAEIVDFYHDDLADGSGKAPITMRLLECYQYMSSWHSTGTSTRDRATWEASDIRSSMNDYAISSTYGPDKALQNVTKKVRKTYRLYGGGYATTEDLWFLPSLSELGYEIEGAEEGSCYGIYSNGKTLGQSYPDLQYTFPDGTIHKYWTRTKLNYGAPYGIDLTGKAEAASQGSSSAERYPLVFMCIG